MTKQSIKAPGPLVYPCGALTLSQSESDLSAYEPDVSGNKNGRKEEIYVPTKAPKIKKNKFVVLVWTNIFFRIFLFELIS